MKYACDVCKATVKARLCGIHLFYDRKFDVSPGELPHSEKLDFPSSQSFAANACSPDCDVLQLGIGHSNVAAALVDRFCRVTAVDFIVNDISEASSPTVPTPMPQNVGAYDYILLMDLIEHLHDPERFMDELRRKMNGRQPEVIITSANVAFFVTRVMLALGQFNYSKKGILGLGHRRLFTFKSLRALLEQAGYEVLEQHGAPAPFPLALGMNRWSRTLLFINRALIKLSKTLFSYQICIRARALPDAGHLLKETIASTSALRIQILDRVA
ncbi:MAG: class I SAM-dependent methyltransferase [Chthoniobacterales bacterium]